MSSVHSKVTASTPLLQNQPDSIISREWFRLIMSMVQIMGNGANITNLDDFEVKLETQRSPFTSLDTYNGIIGRLALLESMVNRIGASFRSALERRDYDIEFAASRRRTSSRSALEQRDYDIECMLLTRRPLSLNNELLLLNTGAPVDGEIPGGVIDGIRVAFTLAYTPISGSVHLFLNGLRMRLTTDYSVSGNTITYTAGAKPQSGDNHYADYRR